MKAKEMAEQVMKIQEDIMFKCGQDDYSELLLAVEELRYFLVNELRVKPLSKPKKDSIRKENYRLIFPVNL